MWQVGGALGRGACVALSMAAVVSFSAVAHPVPDVPVRSFFAPDGSAVVKVELDPRSFTEDPEAAPYLLRDEYLRLSAAQRWRLLAKAHAYLERTVEVSFEPDGVVSPAWTFEFTTFREGPLNDRDDPVMLTGTWRPHLSGRTTYRVRALPEGELSVVFVNYFDRKVLKGLQVLFPGEASRPLPLAGLERAELGDVYEQLLGSVSPAP